MDELVSALRADLALQRDLRDPDIFAVLFEEDHEVIPPRFQASFAKVLKLQQACANESREFSLDLITHSLAAPTAVLDFTPEQQARKRRSGHPNPASDDDDDEEEEKVRPARPPLCSFQVVVSTLVSVLVLVWLTSTTPTTPTSITAPLPFLPPSFQVLGSTGVDLCRFPAPIRTHGATQEITIGDLHGNAMKLVYFLVREGVLRGIPPPEFARMCAIYHSTMSSSTTEFYDLLHRGGGAEIAPDHPTIRLLGDELADRGTNDELTLMVLDKLLSEGDASKVQVLLSNHGFEFYSYDQDDGMARLQFKLLSGEKEHASFTNSLHTFHRTVKDKSRARRVLKALYKHSLKLVSYSIRGEGMLVFTHAPIGLETLQLFARDFGLNTTCRSVVTQSNLQQCIDAVQRKFDSDIKHRLSWGLRRSTSMIEFMWRRNSDRSKATRPTLNGTVAWVHGHDGFAVAPQPYGYCMDDEFGKYVGDTSAGAQTYSVLVGL